MVKFIIFPSSSGEQWPEVGCKSSLKRKYTAGCHGVGHLSQDIPKIVIFLYVEGIYQSIYLSIYLSIYIYIHGIYIYIYGISWPCMDIYDMGPWDTMMAIYHGFHHGFYHVRYPPLLPPSTRIISGLCRTWRKVTTRVSSAKGS